MKWYRKDSCLVRCLCTVFNCSQMVVEVMVVRELVAQTYRSSARSEIGVLLRTTDHPERRERRAAPAHDQQI